MLTIRILRINFFLILGILSFLSFSLCLQGINAQELPPSIQQNVGIDIPEFINQSEGNFNGVVVNPSTNILYISAFDSNNIAMVNGSTNKVFDHIKFDEEIGRFAINPITNTLYVTSRESDHILLVNGSTNKVFDTIPIEYVAWNIAVNPDTNTVYVTELGSNKITVVDGKTKNITGTIIADDIIDDIAIDPAISKIYLLFNSGRIGVLDYESGEKNMIFNTEIDDDGHLAVDSKTNVLYVTDEDSYSVLAIDGKREKVVGTIPIDGNFGEPEDIAINSNTDTIYIVNGESKSVVILNSIKGFSPLNQGTSNDVGIKTMSPPSRIAVNPESNKIYVSSQARSYNDIMVVDSLSDKLTRTIPIGHSTDDIDINPITNTIYASSVVTDSISVINGSTDRVIDAIPLRNPGEIAINPEENMIYVTDFDFNNITIVDGKTRDITGTISAEFQNRSFDDIRDIVISPNLGKIYALTSWYDDVIAVLDLIENNTIGVIATIENIEEIAINPKTNVIYATSPLSDIISVIDGSTDRIVKNIPINNIGEIAINPNTNTVYVTHPSEKYITVIDGEPNEISGTIALSSPAKEIGVNAGLDKLYIYTSDTNSLTIVDGKSNRIMLKADSKFSVSPPNSGSIVCGGEEIITEYPYRLPFNSKCYVKSEGNYHFINWKEDLGNNATRVLNSSNHGAAFWNFWKLLNQQDPDPSSILTVSSPGNYTVNFEKNPTPIPPEYWIPLYGILISTIVGWSIPSVISWIRSKAEGRKLNCYHKRIRSLYRNGAIDYRSINSVDALNTKIIDIYSMGKINESHYNSLKSEISLLYYEIFKKRLDALQPFTQGQEKISEEINKGIKDSYSQGKLNELHKDLLMTNFPEPKK